MAQFIESLDFPPNATPAPQRPAPAGPTSDIQGQSRDAVFSDIPFRDTDLEQPKVPEAAAQPSWVDAEVEVSVATYQAYQILYYAFAGLFAVAGVTKFLHLLAPWDSYVAPGISSFFHLSAGAIVLVAGLIEILAAAAVGLKPRIGSWVVTVWLGLIVLNLLMLSGHYDMVLTDLALGAAGVAFMRLSAECN
jgi:hypothetical protein